MLAFGMIVLSYVAVPPPMLRLGGMRCASVICSATDESTVAATNAADAVSEAMGVVAPTNMQQPRSLSLEQEIDELYDTLERYDVRLRTSEAQVQLTEADMEVAIQRTGAFWISKLAEAKAEAAEAQARAAEAEARVQAAEETSKRMVDTLPALRALLDQLDSPPSAQPEAAVAAKPEAKAVEAVVEKVEKAVEVKAALVEKVEKKEKKEKEAPAKEEAKAAVVEKEAKVEKKAEAKVEEKEAPKEEAKQEAEAASKPTGTEKKPYVLPDSTNGALILPPLDPSMPPMKERYASAKAEGEHVHVAMFEVYEGCPDELLPAMSQLPDEPPLTSPKHPEGPKMKMLELRAKLQFLGYPTTGTRDELETRYDYAMRLDRAKTMSWDSEMQEWVPIQQETGFST